MPQKANVCDFIREIGLDVGGLLPLNEKQYAAVAQTMKMHYWKERDQKIFELRYIQNMTTAETAKALGMTVGNLRRCDQELRSWRKLYSQRDLWRYLKRAKDNA